MFKRSLATLGLLSTLALLGSLLVIQALPAHAQTQCDSTPAHCYSNLWDQRYEQGHGFYQGVSDRFTAYPITLTNNTDTYFGSNALWSFVNDVNGDYLEVGFTHCINTRNVVGCQNGQASGYYGYIAMNGYVIPQGYFSDSPTNTFRWVKIVSSPDASHPGYFDWYVEYNNGTTAFNYTFRPNLGSSCHPNVLGWPCINDDTGNGYDGTSGGEFDSVTAGVHPSQSTGTFDNYLGEEVNGSWVTWQYHVVLAIDHPCGQYPAGQCLNGFYQTSTAEWLWNKA